MKKKSISLIIWLMSIALIGVMAMQYFFIKESYDQKSQIFDETVKASLSIVANKIERQEVYDFAKEQERLNQEKYIEDQTKQKEKESLLAEQVRIQNEINHLSLQNFKVVEKYRSEEKELRSLYPDAVAVSNTFFETYVKRPGYRHLIDIQFQRSRSPHDMLDDISVIVSAKQTVSEVSAKDDSSRFIIPTKFDAHTHTVFEFVWATLSPKEDKNVLEQLKILQASLELHKLALADNLFDTLAVVVGKNQRLIDDIATSVAMSRKPLEQRLNTDSAIRYLQKEFEARDIYSPFIMQVRKDIRSPMIIQAFHNINEKDFKKIQRGSEYSAPLFQGDEGNSPGLLTVYFPSRNSIILSSMLSYLILPVFTLLALLVGCFAYTLSIIFRQKKVSEMKTDFINNMTHEFKTPVATIMIASESLRDPEIATNQARVNKLANIIYDENIRLGSHIERVLDIARLEKENLKIERTKVAMNDLVSDVLESMRLQLEKVNGKFTINLKAEEDVVVGDELHLSNVIYNLIDNAIKYSKDAPDITVNTYNGKNSIFITVSDKGIGMSKEHQEKIFDQFYRIPTGNVHNVKGFGLGLSYVNNIIKMLNGKITVKSEKDKGTQFEVTLPSLKK